MNNTLEKPAYRKGFTPYAIAAALVSLCGGFTASIPNNIVSVWQIDTIYATWITLAMSMGMAACAPVLGKMGDVLGRRGTVLFGIVLMGAGELIIGITPIGVIWLVLLGRFIVGVGSAAIAPTVIGYITSEFPQEKMGQGFTIYMVLSSVMVIFGPTVGGLLFMATGNYRIILYVCAGLAAICFFIALSMIKKDTSPKKGLAGFDIVGGIFIIIFFSLALCVPTMGQNSGWASKTTLVIIGCALVALLALILAEKHAKNPILNGKFMARKQFILPVIVLFLTQGLMQACMTNTIRFTMMFDPNSTVGNYATSIMYIGMTLGVIFMGPQADKKEPRYVSAFALVFCLIGAAIQLLYKQDSGFLVYAASLFFIGLGLGGNGTIFLKVALSGLSPQEAGAGSGTYTVFRDLSAPFGVAVFVPMFTTHILYENSKPIADSVVSSIHNVAIVQMLCVVLGIIVCLMLPKVYNKETATKE